MVCGHMALILHLVYNAESISKSRGSVLAFPQICSLFIKNNNIVSRTSELMKKRKVYELTALSNICILKCNIAF